MYTECGQVFSRDMGLELNKNERRESYIAYFSCQVADATSPVCLSGLLL